MGIRGKFFTVITVIAVVVALSTYGILEHSHESLIEKEAVRIAEIVSTQVVSEGAEYTQNLVGKLVKEGTGAAQDSQAKPGYIPLPAQFVRNVSQRVRKQAGDLYRYSLVSRWNLNPDQGLKDEFDRWAWSQLAAQDAVLSKSAPPATGYAWKSAYRFETANGAAVLRYMRADPAAAPACVSCHDMYEQKPEIAEMRKRQGVEVGRTWKLHQLMGALRVEIPVDQVAATAAAGRNKTLAALAGIFVVGFGGLLGLMYQSIIKPVERSVREVEGFSGKVDSVVGCSKDLVLEADAQTDACRSATKVAGTGDFSAVSRSLEALANAANGNAMKAEESAMHCNELQFQFTGLRSRLQKMLGESEV